MCERTLRQNWLEGVRGGRHCVRLHAPEPGPLPLAVVLGLVLHRDRVAALRRGPRRATELESLLAAQRDGRLHRPHDLLGQARRPGSPLHLQRALAVGLDDREHPAAGARMGVADRGRRPGGRARHRPPARWLERQPRPRRRRPDLDRPARRVGARRLAAVRSDLARARPRAAGVRAAGAAQPPAGLRPAPDRPRGRARCAAR